MQPVVVVVDGLQWADRASLDLLREMLRRSESLPILTLLLTRLEERVTSYIEGLVRIELRGLSAEDQMRLVEARLGVRHGVANVCRELVPRVAGNPFFLLEMIDALLERGTLEIVERGDGRHELVRHERPGDRRESLPSTLEQLIGDRLRELPGAEHDVVDWLAVAGGPLAEAELLALARLSEDEAITRLCARGLCDRKSGSVDFRHPLARDVAYLALDPRNRARMHLLLGEHLARTPLGRGLSAAIVAQHLARGESNEPAADLYLEAASAARISHQQQLALRYYQRAIGLLPAGDSRCILAHAALEAIYQHLGRREERRKHLGALRKLAKESGQARWVALALVRTARLECNEGQYQKGLPIAQKAAELARVTGQPALEVEALTVLSEILRDVGDVQGAIRACERALQVTHSGQLPQRARAEVLRSKGVLLRRVGRVDEAVHAHVEAIAVFRAVGARRSEARAKNSLAFAMFVMERFEDAIALGLSAIAIDLAIGGRFQIAKTLSNVGQAYARLGDTPRGFAYLKRAREAHQRYADQDGRADTLFATACIFVDIQDIDKAQAHCDEASAIVAVTGSSYDRVHEHIARSLIALARSDIQPAITHASAARQLAEPQGLMSYNNYATAIEAVARVEAGEHHTGVLLAHTAFAAVEAMAGSEYAIEVRGLCCAALSRGAPETAREVLARAAAHVKKVADCVRDPRLKSLFLRRSVVERILSDAEGTGADVHDDPLSRGGTA
jgi:eukaryotic-like serine/threonine-protein kinase